MKTIEFKDSYEFLKYLFENKIISRFSKEMVGLGEFAVYNDAKSEDDEIEKLVEVINDDFFHNTDFVEYIGTSADFEIVMNDDKMEMKSSNSTDLGYYNPDVTQAVKKCFIELFKSELHIEKDDFEQNYEFCYELEIYHGGWDDKQACSEHDKINNVILYKDDIEIELTPHFIEKMFNKLRNVLNEFTLTDYDSAKTFIISECSIYEEFESHWDFDFLKNDGRKYTFNYK